MKRTIILGFLSLLLVSCAARTGVLLTHSGLLSYGDSVEQVLSGPDQQHRWDFVGRAGDVIRVELTARGISPALTLADSTGQQLGAVSEGSYEGRSALEDIRLPADGAYTLLITLSGEGQGMYTLSLSVQPPETPSPTLAAVPSAVSVSNTRQPSDGPAQDQPLTPSVTAVPIAVESGIQLQPRLIVQGQLRQPGEVDRYTIFGEAGDLITLGAMVGENSAVDPFVAVFDPAGEMLAQAGDTFGSRDAIIAGVRLPSTGAYIVFVRDAGGQAMGSYDIAFGYGTTMLDHLQPVAEPDEVYNGAMVAPAVRDVWPLELTLGDVISAAVVVGDDSPLDPVLSLVSPDGTVLYEDDNGGGGRNAALRQVIAPESGRFFLAVSPAAPLTLGAYTLIWRFEAQAPTPSLSPVK